MSRKTKILEFNKICRTCMSEKKDLKPLFDACLADMLMKCISVKVEKNDGLPSNVCSRCFLQISKFCSFKSRAERADANLRKCLKDNLKIPEDQNIIMQAANDADIDISDENIKIYKLDNEDCESDDVKPEKKSKTKGKRRFKDIKTIKLHKLEVTTEDELKNTEIDIGEITTETQIQISGQIFSDGPPPLVPLVPIEKIPEFPVTNTVSVEALKPISNETPPLIPIKPSDNMVTLFSTLEAEDQEIKSFCNTCNKEFSDPSFLREHLLSTHSNSSGLACIICKKTFNCRKRLIGHLKGHTVVKHYACKICEKRYPNPSTFQVHMRSHTGERPFKCQECGKGFIRWASVVSHMKSHNLDKPYQCETCYKTFKVGSNLERHKVLHSGLLPFCCNYCGKCFSQNDNLQLHIRTYHTNERPFLCSQCGKGFVSATRLNRHMWSHTGYKPYSCNMCNKAYTNSNDLKNHLRTHNGGHSDADKPYACMECHMRFYQPCRLTKHMKTHARPYACTDCLKTFSREDTLIKHITNKHGIDEKVEISAQESTYIVENY